MSINSIRPYNSQTFPVSLLLLCATQALTKLYSITVVLLDTDADLSHSLVPSVSQYASCSEAWGLYPVDHHFNTSVQKWQRAPSSDATGDWKEWVNAWYISVMLHASRLYGYLASLASGSMSRILTEQAYVWPSLRIRKHRGRKGYRRVTDVDDMLLQICLQILPWLLVTATPKQLPLALSATHTCSNISDAFRQFSSHNGETL